MRTTIVFLALLFWMNQAVAAVPDAPNPIGNATANTSAAGTDQHQGSQKLVEPPIAVRTETVATSLSNTDQLFLGLASFLIVGGLAAWLGKSTDMLRDSQPVDFGGAKPSAGGQYRRPYSLAQVQMTWWFCIIIASYVYIACSKQLINGILTEQALILMGIGTGVALGAAAIEQVKGDNLDTINAFNAVLAQIAALPDGTAVPADLVAQRDKLAPKLASENFFRDILTDVDGVCLHRFQALLWTGILGIFFATNVVTHLAMPAFDNVLLAALGISGGTYLGFKVPEQPA